MPNDSIKGLLEAGNVNLYSRPRILNPDGSISTIFSMGMQDDQGREVLVQGVNNKQKL